MSMGEFAYANHSNRFLAAAPLALQPQAPFVLAGVPYDGAVTCLLYTSPSPRDATLSRMPSSA